MSSRFSLRFLNPEISLLKKSLEGLTFVFRNFCCSQMASRCVGPPKIFYYFNALWKIYKNGVKTTYFYPSIHQFLQSEPQSKNQFQISKLKLIISKTTFTLGHSEIMKKRLESAAADSKSLSSVWKNFYLLACRIHS